MPRGPDYACHHVSLMDCLPLDMSAVAASKLEVWPVGLIAVRLLLLVNSP
jgi:hypothetical protein